MQVPLRVCRSENGVDSRISLFLIVRAEVRWKGSFPSLVSARLSGLARVAMAKQSSHLRGGLGAGAQLGLTLAGGFTEALVMGDQLFGREVFGLLVDAGLGAALGFHAFVFFKFHR